MPRVAAALVDIQFVEVLNDSHWPLSPLYVVVITVRGKGETRQDPKYAASSLSPNLNGHYIRRGAHPNYNVKVKGNM